MTEDNLANNTPSTTDTSTSHHSLPEALTSLIKTKALLNNIRNLEIKAVDQINVEVPSEICSGKNLIVYGKPVKTTFAPLLIGAAERLNQGYDNSIILIITPNMKCNTVIYDLVRKLCHNSDILHANCSARNSKRDIDTRVFVGTFDSIFKGVSSNKIPAADVSLVVLPQINASLEAIELNEFKELFSTMAKHPQVVVTAVENSDELSKFKETFMNESGEITITGQDTMIEHTYVEVGSDLLDKTNALCDIIETTNSDGVLVYCNSDSDTDLVQVILRKRGFEVERILSERAEREDAKNPAEIMRQVEEREISTVITNDSAAEDLDLDHFDLVIHYGIPSEPSLYISRIGGDGAPAKLTKVISLVGPLDFTNFHVIKKAVTVPLNQQPLPNKEDVVAAKVNKLASAALKADYSKDDRISQLLPIILNNPNRDSILSMLIYNTLTVIPELKKAKEAPVRSARSERYDRNDRGEDRERRGNRRDRDERRGNRRERGGWESREEGRGRRNNGRSENRGQDREGRYGRDRRSADIDETANGADGHHESAHSEKRREDPPKRDVRFYIGQGSSDGFSKDSLADLMSAHCGLSEADIKRLSIRGRYSFADFAEENAPAIIEKLAGVTNKDGSPLFVKKATIISVPRERAERADESSQSEESSEDLSAIQTDSGDSNDAQEMVEESNGDYV